MVPELGGYTPVNRDLIQEKGEKKKKIQQDKVQLAHRLYILRQVPATLEQHQFS